jgi:hypothetical protein
LTNTFPSKSEIRGRQLEAGQKYIELNKNENTIYKNVQDTAKAVLREKFIALNIYIRKYERYQMNNLSSLNI